MQKLFVCALAFLLGAYANAATVQITNVSRASNFVSGSSPAETPIIYGAIAGSQWNCNTTASTAFCNNCVGTDTCSEKRVHSKLLMRIHFKVTSKSAGYVTFGIMDGGNARILSGLYNKSTTGLMREGDSGFIEVPWGTVLDAMGSGAQGDVPVTNVNFFIAISLDNTISHDEASQVAIKAFAPGNNIASEISDITCGDGKDGVCSFVMSAGDESIFIDPIEPSGSYPTVDNVPVKSLRLYYSTMPSEDIRNIDYTYPYVDMLLDSTGAPFSQLVGFENDVFVGGKLAIVDEAGNISHMISNEQISLECLAPTLDAAGASTCPFIAMPFAPQSYP